MHSKHSKHRTDIMLAPCTDMQPGDLAWVKLRGFPRWPARVCSPKDGGAEVATKRKPGTQLVHSFGDQKYLWIGPKDLSPFTAASAEEALGKGGNVRLRQAIAEAQQAALGRGTMKRKRGAAAAEDSGGADEPGSSAADADLVEAAA